MLNVAKYCFRISVVSLWLAPGNRWHSKVPWLNLKHGHCSDEPEPLDQRTLYRFYGNDAANDTRDGGQPCPEEGEEEYEHVVSAPPAGDSPWLFFFFLKPCFLFASAAPVMMDGLQGGSRWRWEGVALSPWTWRAPEEAHVVRWSQLKRKNLRRSFGCGTEPCLQGLCIRTLLSDVPIRTCHMQDKTFRPEINREPPKWLCHPGRLERTQSFVLSQIISHWFPQKTSYFLMRLCSCESITCIKRLCSAIFGERGLILCGAL